jgi:hypothetical protein
MRKYAYLVFGLAFFILLHGCRRDSSLTSKGNWKVNNISYNVNSTSRSNANEYFKLIGTDAKITNDTSTSNLFTVYFSATPLISKSYKVIRFPSLNPLTSDQIGISATIRNSGRTYYTSGIESNKTWLPALDAQVTVNNAGKIKINIPTTMLYILGPTYIDTVSFSGTLTEQ